MYAPTSRTSGSRLLERSRQLALLGESLDAVRSTARGRLMLVRGEAGVGKTALIRRFCDEQHGSARILWGACDALFTPRPLGPLLDIADAAGGELEEHARSGARPHDVARALMHELDGRTAAVVVLEDVHWADEATLDVMKLVARRIEAVPALVIASYRDASHDHAGPLRIVLGELATSRVIGRVELAALSPAAVATLAERHGVDADELYRKTAGNPFFVTEVLAAVGEEVPHTIRDAVHARLARLSPAARRTLEAIAVVPQRVEPWLLQALARDDGDPLDECLASGMLTRGAGGVAFRHELARVAVEESLPRNRAVALHRDAIAALVAHAPDPARLAHHAEAAEDAGAVLRFAPAAAARAASLGAHREAAAQYARALRFGDGLAPEALAGLLESRSHECFLTYQFEEAIAARQRALGCHRGRGNLRKEGDLLLSLSWLLWHTGRTAEADEAAREAVALLERLPPGRELASAYATMSQLLMEAEDAEPAAAWGMRAIELAEHLDDIEVRIRTLVTLGTIEFLSGSPAKLERSLELARAAGLEEQVGRAFTNLAWVATRLRVYALADRYVEAGLAYYGDSDVALWPPYLLAMRARSLLERGRWAEAAATAATVVGDTRAAYALDRPLSLAVLGLVRARRGDPHVWPPLDEALALVQPSGELQRLAPVAAARAETLWLQGRREAVADATQLAFDLALRRRAAWDIGELACWRRRAGIRDPVPVDTAEPYGLQLAGEWERAAERWTAIGCPYEAALALADAHDEGALRRALDELHRLGARSPPRAVRVPARHVGAVREQHRHEALVAGRRRHAEQIVAVGPARGGELGKALEQRGQRIDVMRLDRAVRAHERLARLMQPGDMTAEPRPARESVLARHGDPRSRHRQRHVMAGERRHRTLGAVFRGGQQPVRPALVVVEVLVVGVLQGRPARGDPVDVGPQLRPASEAVLARDHELRVAELQPLVRLRVVVPDAGERGRVARAVGAHQVLGLLAKLLQALTGWKRCGHDSLVS